MSRQVYTNTVRARTQRAQGNTNHYSSYPVSTSSGIRTNNPNMYNSPAHSSISCVGGSTVSPAKPTGQELRNARLQRFAGVYEMDKQAHVKKEEERKRKQLLAKLERYKGVGELGTRLSDQTVTEDDKYDGFWRSRDGYQYKHDDDAISALEKNQQRDKELQEKKIAKSMEKLNLRTVTNQEPGPSPQIQPELAQRLGGHSHNRVRGQHPLLAKLTSSPQNSDN